MDLLARRVLVACLLYYQEASPSMTDGEFDAACQVLADRWDEIPEERRWQLGTPDEIRSGGSHVKCTAATLGAAGHRLGRRIDVSPESWQVDEGTGLRWFIMGG